MASAPPQLPSIRTVEVDVIMTPGGRPVRIRVPGNSKSEAYELLSSVGNGTVGGLARHSVLEPIRAAYKRDLDKLSREIARRRTALGSNASPAQLETLAKWASAERTKAARLWRIPLPVTGLGLEARDWMKYGVGGRTYNNLMRGYMFPRAGAGLTREQSVLKIIGSSTTSNPKYNAAIARGARVLRGGGGVLAVAGLGNTAYDIWQAPAAERGAIAQRHAVGLAGGVIGAEVVGGLATFGVGLLVATPPGWVVIAIGAVGIAGGVAGGMLADHLFYPDNHQKAANTLSSGRPLRCTPSNPLGSPLTARARR